MPRPIEEPVQLRPGYHYYRDRGVAIVEAPKLRAAASRLGPVGDGDTWLALSDSICFQDDVLPPDLLLVLRLPPANSELVLRAQEVDHE